MTSLVARAGLEDARRIAENLLEHLIMRKQEQLDFLAGETGRVGSV
jgi:hypothetical protein